MATIPESHIAQLSLPCHDDQLLKLYEQTPEKWIRICILASIRNNVGQRRHKADNVAYLNTLMTFLEDYEDDSGQYDTQKQLFLHVQCLAIRHYFNETEFMVLPDQITSLIDCNKDRLNICLDLFVEIIDVVESSQSHEQLCLFQRYFLSQHLNSMMTLANYLIERSVQRNSQQGYSIWTTAECLTKIFTLLHRALSYDFQHEIRRDESDEFMTDRISIVIPTKFSRHANFLQYERWIRSSDLLQIYEFVYFATRNAKLKRTIVELLGDMSRIHMKYFRSKANYKTHIENIVLVFGNIIESLQVTSELFMVALAVGNNINKLVTPAAVVTFFEINPNLQEGIIISVANFICRQIIGNEILNTSLLRYYFQFINAISYRGMFEDNEALMEKIQSVINSIGRAYEPFLHALVHKLFQHRTYNHYHYVTKVDSGNYYSSKYHKNRNHSSYQGDIDPNNNNYSRSSYRGDIEWLGEAISSSNVAELEIFMLPFKCYKPRKTVGETCGYEKMILLCARVQRCMYRLESNRIQSWERDSSQTTLSQCISKLSECYSNTAHYKSRNAPSSDTDQEQQFGHWKESISRTFAVIKEESAEEIENEEEYCGVIHLVLMYMLDKVNLRKHGQLNDLNNGYCLYRLIDLCLLFILDTIRDDLKEGTSDCRKKMVNLAQETLALATGLFEWFHYNWKQRSRGSGFEQNSTISEREEELQEWNHLLHTARNIVCELSTYSAKSDSEIPLDELLPMVQLLSIHLTLEYQAVLQQNSNFAVSVSNIQQCEWYILSLTTHAQLQKQISQKEPKVSELVSALQQKVIGYCCEEVTDKDVSALIGCMTCFISVQFTDEREQLISQLSSCIKLMIPLLPKLQGCLLRKTISATTALLCYSRQFIPLGNQLLVGLDLSHDIFVNLHRELFEELNRFVLALTSRINAECLEKAIGCWNRVKAGMIAHDAALRNCFENSLRLLAQCGGICHVQLEEAERFLGLLLELLKTKGVGSAIISLNLVYDFLLSLSQVSAEVERLVRTTRQQFANLTEVQKDAAVMEAVEQKIISCNTECLQIVQLSVGQTVFDEKEELSQCNERNELAGQTQGEQVSKSMNVWHQDNELHRINGQYNARHLPLRLYNGYHRNKTLQVASKYLEAETDVQQQANNARDAEDITLKNPGSDIRWEQGETEDDQLLNTDNRINRAEEGVSQMIVESEQKVDRIKGNASKGFHENTSHGITVYVGDMNPKQ